MNRHLAELLSIVLLAGCGRTVELPSDSMDASLDADGAGEAPVGEAAQMDEPRSVDVSWVEASPDGSVVPDVSVQEVGSDAGNDDESTDADASGETGADADAGCDGCSGPCVHGHCRIGCNLNLEYACAFGVHCCPFDVANARGYCVNEPGEICGGCADGGCCAAPLSICPPGPNGFEPVCTSLASDPNHCGDCATRCEEPRATCMAGVCVCITGAICDGVCTYTPTNLQNCGACGHACTAAGQTCEEGQCTCPMDRPTVCDGACTDLESDPANCGLCGKACSGATTACLDGVCAGAPDVLAAGENMPSKLVIDATALYWTEFAMAGRVRKLGLSGGSPATLAENRSYPWQLISDGKNLYWNEFPVGIWSLPVGGGTPTKLADTTTFALAVRGSTLFFTGGTISGPGQNAFVSSIPTAGGAATQLICCYANSEPALAVDDTFVYFGAYRTMIHRAPFGVTPVESTKLVDTPVTSSVSLFIDGTNLYWITMRAVVGKVPLSGGSATILANNMTPQASTLDLSLLVSSGYVYWTDSSNPGAVRKVSVDGGKITTIANRQDTPAGIAIDDQYVYWVNHNAAGTVMRAPR